MKAGLLGAIGGVGAAMTGFGTDLMRRREQALEDARELAKEERRRIDTREREDRQTGLRIDLHEDTQRNQAALKERDIEARREDIGTRQAGQERLVKLRDETTEARMKRMADYNDRLSRSRTVASQQSAAAIRNGEVVDAFTTGKPVKRPDGQKREQIMHELGDGTIVATGQWIAPGSSLSPSKGRQAAKRTSMIDDLDLEEEEEEEDD